MGPTRKPANDAAGLIALVRRHAPPDGGRLWVAYSGGRDSTVLLHLAAAVRDTLGALVLRAVHVNHGLNAAAPEWAWHCARACAALHVPLAVLAVDARARRGESPQAAARRARYAALRALLRPGDLIATAHHRRDQAETVLLRALRGSGPGGLAAMAAARPLGPGWLLRPLLGWPAEEVAQYARRAGLAWIEDPGNVDLRYARAYLRRQVWPVIESRWPGAETTLARLAAHAADLTAEVPARTGLDLGMLRGLPPGRRAGAVRRHLAERAVPPPPAARLAEGLRALIEAAPDRAPELRWGAYRLRRYRDRLHLLPGALGAPPAGTLRWALHTALVLPGLGRLEAAVQDAAGGAASVAGLDAGRLGPQSVLEVRFRAGGEVLRTAAGRRPLKKLLQESGVPPWRRARLPLLLRDGECVGVAGLWCAPAWAARPGRAAWVIRWADALDDAAGCGPAPTARPP